MKVQTCETWWKLLPKVVRLWRWLGWFRAFLINTSQVLQYSNNLKTISRPDLANLTKNWNWQSYQTASIFLPRVIPTILMRSWYMCSVEWEYSWLTTKMLRNWSKTKIIAGPDLWNMMKKLKIVKFVGSHPYNFLKW